MNNKIIFMSAALVACMACPVLAQETTTTTTVTGEKSHAGAGAGIIGGAATGALVGGPIGAVVGGVIGAAAGATLDPPADVKTYVRTSRVDPVTYSGPLVVGTVVPDTITVYDVPKYERYRWTYVNHQRILIDHQTHKIVSVMNDDQ
jgi:hypothetical protein